MQARGTKKVIQALVALLRLSPEKGESYGGG